MRIEIDDLQRPQVHALLRAHLQGMYAQSPPDKVFALDLSGLQQPDVTLWTAWEGDEVLGCGALKELSATHAELKSMRTHAQHLRKGVAQAILDEIEREALRRGYLQLSLETGTTPGFEAAHRFYQRNGFVASGPFADYREDDFSTFMTKILA